MHSKVNRGEFIDTQTAWRSHKPTLGKYAKNINYEKLKRKETVNTYCSAVSWLSEILEFSLPCPEHLQI
jgi:hypothetical protein